MSFKITAILVLKNKRAYGAKFPLEGGRKGYFAKQNSPFGLSLKKISSRSGVNLGLDFQNENCCNLCQTTLAFNVF